MKRFILTGTPGSGKTSLIKALEQKGYFVIPEAATDIIASEQKKGNHEPWRYPNFIDNIITQQKHRQIQVQNLNTSVQFYDRSPICAYALALYLGFVPSALLLEEIERIKINKIYEKTVFFIENLGFCESTESRKISFEEALKFEQIHLDTYAKFGYKIFKIPAVSIDERVKLVDLACENLLEVFE